MTIDKEKIKVNFHSSICLCGNIYIDPLNYSKKLNNAKVVFVTHSHWDHLDEASIKNVSTSDTIFVCPNDCKEKLLSLGMKTENIVVVEPNKSYQVLDLSVDTFPAYNLNKDFHPKANGWVGYKIVADGVSYTICGDTDVTEDLKKIKTDVLFVPIGGTYTMTAEEAVRFVNHVKPKFVVPVHYGKVVGGKQDEKLFALNLDKDIDCLLLIKV